MWKIDFSDYFATLTLTEQIVSQAFFDSSHRDLSLGENQSIKNRLWGPNLRYIAWLYHIIVIMAQYSAGSIPAPQSRFLIDWFSPKDRSRCEESKNASLTILPVSVKSKFYETFLEGLSVFRYKRFLYFFIRTSKAYFHSLVALAMYKFLFTILHSCFSRVFSHVHISPKSVLFPFRWLGVLRKILKQPLTIKNV